MRAFLRTMSFVTLILTFVVSVAHSNETHGLFMVVKGDVKITSLKEGKTDSAKVGKKVFAGDTIVAGKDARAKIVMSDKNVLNISPDSKITIEKYVNDGKEKNVELKVDYGKVRASVEQKYDGEKNKFQIKTPSAVAGVRGTDFLTSYNPQTRISQVITFSGLVSVGKMDAAGKVLDAVFVRPGEMTSASENSKPEVPKAVPQDQLKNMEKDSGADTARNEPPAPKQEQAAKPSSDSKEQPIKSEQSPEQPNRLPANAPQGDGLAPQLPPPELPPLPPPPMPRAPTNVPPQAPQIDTTKHRDAIIENRKVKTTIIINQ